MFKVICFYPINRGEPAVWVCSCMICGGLHACHVWENTHDAGYRRGGVWGMLAGHVSYLGESAVMCCMSFMGRTLGGVVKLVEFIAPCWVLRPSYCEPLPIFFALSCHHSSQLCGSPQGSGPGEEEVGQCPAQLGKLDTHCALPFPMGETADLSGLFWHWAVSPWERGDAGNLKLFFLPFLLHLFSYFLLQECVGTPLLDSWAPTKILSSMCGCQNQCFYEEMKADNSYSAILHQQDINHLFRWFPKSLYLLFCLLAFYYKVEISLLTWGYLDNLKCNWKVS